MFPKKGKIPRGGNDRENGQLNCAALIARALHSELGSSHRAAKTVMGWTGASERTVKHWLAGLHGPRADYLIVLMRECEAVFEAIATGAGRRDAVVAARLLAAQTTMSEVTQLLERAGDIRGDVKPRRPGAAPDELTIASNDRDNDPEDDRGNDSITRALQESLNPRQHWYLAALAANPNARAADLQRHWGVSEKTARRDLALLKCRGIIAFDGSCRGGRYRLSR